MKYLVQLSQSSKLQFKGHLLRHVDLPYQQLLLVIFFISSWTKLVRTFQFCLCCRACLGTTSSSCVFRTKNLSGRVPAALDPAAGHRRGTAGAGVLLVQVCPRGAAAAMPPLRVAEGGPLAGRLLLAPSWTPSLHHPCGDVPNDVLL